MREEKRRKEKEEKEREEKEKERQTVHMRLPLPSVYCVCEYMFTCVHMCRSQVNVGCLPQLFSTFLWDRSLTHPEAHSCARLAGWWAARILQCPSPQYWGCRHVMCLSFYVDAGDPKRSSSAFLLDWAISPQVPVFVWPWILNIPASASQLLGLCICFITHCKARSFYQRKLK